MPSRSSDIDPLARTIGNAARRARKRLQLTQEQAARRIGVSTEFYGRLERGHQLPSVATLRKVVDGLETSASDLLGLSDETSWAAAARSLGMPSRRSRTGRTDSDRADVRRIEDRLRNASPGTIQLTLALIKAFERPDDEQN